MNRNFAALVGLCFLSLNLASPISAAETTASVLASNIPPTLSEKVLTPTREQGRIAFLAARLLEGLHYTHQLFDQSVSSRFLDEYLETLDPQRLHFLRSDIEEFEQYRTNLDELTVEQPGVSDLSPAFRIFSIFMERLEQRVNYANDLLKNENFTFDTDERITIDRRELPYPRDLTAAKKLWRDRLRYEYLHEKLDRIEAEKKKTNTVAEITISTNSINDASVSSNTPAAPLTIAEVLSHRYQRNLRMFKEWDSDDVLQIYLSSLARCYDPHSEYFGKPAMDSFSIQMNLALSGIGAELFSSEDGYCTIRKLMAGGPAIKSGKIAENDRIVAVAQSNQPPVDVVEMSVNKIVQLIRGPKGTEVRLTISPPNSAERKVVTLVRDEIPLADQAAKSKLIEFTRDNGKKVRIGVIDLPSFYAPVPMGLGAPSNPEDAHYTSADVALLLTKLKEEKVDGVILDLRRNGGGSLEEAIKLTGLFIKDGPVVQVRGGTGSVEVDEDTDPTITYDGPLIVLTSRFSASASEIVAGALQDYGRALIVGDVSTHGKGTVQNVNQLADWMRWPTTNNPGAIKVTIRKFYRASGVSTQFKGVMPDIVLPSPLNYLKDIGEASLDYPMPAGEPLPRAKFQPVNRVEPYLSELLARSSSRVATNRDFAYVREEIDQVRKRQEDKTVSLNEKEVLKEMDEQQARNDARDKERASRLPIKETVYDISLKQAIMPGLPPPVGQMNSVASTDVTADDDSTSSSAGVSKSPPVDVDMTESEHIMVDYLSLLAKNNLASTVKPLPNEQ